MKWTKEDNEVLNSFKKTVDNDNIKNKEIIKSVLVENKYIAHVLNNKELEDSNAEPDDYYGINILPYYLIPEVQSKVQNFICYEVGYTNVYDSNPAFKVLQITFYILCHQMDIIDEDTGLARHDLLAALIQDQFDFSTYFGEKIKLVSDKPSTTDTKYACRTLIFEQLTDNNLVKTINGKARFANKIEGHRIGIGTN